MERSHDSSEKSISRVPFDEASFNGYILCDRNIPVEILIKIFCHTDHEILLNCQLVCKHWWMTIQNHVWHQKAKLALGKKFPRGKNIPWHVFYLICKKKPFERNLLKNHSGEQGIAYWKTNVNRNVVSRFNDVIWKIENPPVDVPELPLTESIFEEKQICFATSYLFCFKRQVVDLEAEGFHPYVLDVLQPPILVSDWYSSPGNVIYKCRVELFRESERENNTVEISRLQFDFIDNITQEKQKQWLHMSHVFENYGSGLRKIAFTHGRDFTERDYSIITRNTIIDIRDPRTSIKMAGACIRVQIPPVIARSTMNPQPWVSIGVFSNPKKMNLLFAGDS